MWEVGEKAPLDGSPQRWEFALHLLDAMFEQTWNGAPASPDLTMTDQGQKALEKIGSAFRFGATPECRFAMLREPHYVLLRKEYYTDTLSSGSSLIDLMGRWAIEWLRSRKDFKDDLKRLMDKLGLSRLPKSLPEALKAFSRPPSSYKAL